MRLNLPTGSMFAALIPEAFIIALISNMIMPLIPISSASGSETACSILNFSYQDSQGNAHFNMSKYNKPIQTGIALRKMGNFDEALAAYNEAIDLNPMLSEAWYGQAVTLYDLGRYNDSIKSFDTAIKLNPDWGEPWYGKGQALDQLGWHEDALEAYDRAVALNLRSVNRSMP